MTLSKFIKHCKSCQAAWVSEGETLVSIHNKCQDKAYDWVKWGVEKKYLSFAPNEDNYTSYFFTEKGMKEVVQKLKETTCAFSGKTVR